MKFNPGHVVVSLTVLWPLLASFLVVEILPFYSAVNVGFFLFFLTLQLFVSDEPLLKAKL